MGRKRRSAGQPRQSREEAIPQTYYSLLAESISELVPPPCTAFRGSLPSLRQCPMLACLWVGTPNNRLVGEAALTLRDSPPHTVHTTHPYPLVTAGRGHHPITPPLRFSSLRFSILAKSSAGPGIRPVFRLHKHNTLHAVTQHRIAHFSLVYGPPTPSGMALVLLTSSLCSVLYGSGQEQPRFLFFM